MKKLLFGSLIVVAVTQLALANHPHHPPPEAIDACKAKQAGDDCSFSARGHDLAGKCFAPPDGGELACRPPPPKEAVDACEKHARGDACSFDVDGQHVSGQCDGPPDRPLACRPEGPPP